MENTVSGSQKIIVADDHPLFRSALQQGIREVFSDIQIIECDTIKNLEAQANQHRDADLVLLDLRMPGASGFSGLVLMRREFPDIPVVVISASEEPANIQRALDYGASGFIPKSADLPTIGKAISEVLAGNVWVPQSSQQYNASDEEQEFSERLKSLTPQQLKVFMMLTKGLLNKQIADEINVSEATIRTHMTAIFRKLGVRNRTQAVLMAKYLDVSNPVQNDNKPL